MRSIIIFIFLFSTSIFAADKASTDNSELMNDIYDALEGVAKKHGTDIENVFSLVPEVSVNRIADGCGIGERLTLRNGQYITNILKGNQISSGGDSEPRDQWNGRGLGTTELVILESGKIKSAIELNGNKSELQFVLFEPKNITYFSWSHINGSQEARSCFSPLE